MTKATLFLLSLVGFALAAAEPLGAQNAHVRTTEDLAIRRIAGEDEANVARYLGPAAKCERQGTRLKCLYKLGSVEVVFRDGKADWVTIFPAGLPFSHTALARYGLPKDRKPSEANARQVRWTNIDWFYAVLAVAAGDGGVDYVRAQVRTP